MNNNELAIRFLQWANEPVGTYPNLTRAMRVSHIYDEYVLRNKDGSYRYEGKVHTSEELYEIFLDE